jgi:hypothetical protein
MRAISQSNSPASPRWILLAPIDSLLNIAGTLNLKTENFIGNEIGFPEK